MSEMAKAARSAMKAKAERLASGDPHAKVDASGWTPPEMLKANVQTGPRPVSPRQYKRGGKVEGAKAQARADRKPRKNGGPTEIDSIINRDVKRANEYREGEKHIGGMKKGGRAHKADGGSFVPEQRMQFQSGPSQMSRAGGYKNGGHPDEKQDMALIKREVKESALRRAEGGRTVTKPMAAAPYTSYRAKGPYGDIAIGAHNHDEALSEARRSNPDIKKSHIDVWNGKSYEPIVKKRGGSVSDGEIEGTRPTGGRMARKSGGRSGKGKMSVNIVIAPGGRGDQGMMPDAGAPKPQGAPVAMPPMGAPPPMQVPVAGPQMAPPPGLGAGMPPGGMMPRKSGGRAYNAGAGGGEGRLEKIERYGEAQRR